MSCPGCGHENRDGARFCNECGAPLAAPCAGCGVENAPGAKFCDGCGTPLAAGGAAPSPNVQPSQPPGALLRRHPSDYTPKHLADKILQSKSALEGERKQVTVVFADVKGFCGPSCRSIPTRGSPRVGIGDSS